MASTMASACTCCCLLVALTAASATSTTTSSPPPPPSTVRPASTLVEAMDGVSVTVDADGATPVGTGLKVLLKLYDDCARRDGLVQCVKVKAATLLDRVARAGDLPITETLVLVRRGDAHRSQGGRALSEAEVEAALPPGDSYAAKDARLNELLWERLARVLSSHTVQLSFPKVSASEMRGISSGGTGRGKMKSMMKMMMMGAAMGMMGMLPIMMGGVSMMALKALVVSKLALVLAIIMILKKLLGGGGVYNDHDNQCL
ncbi:uncharacterized protein LOC113209234 [Frankliniella occidentalis]|uniref:Uncharacterized protein LOC113209234 n=1 Tax=Frankliniella occidentalis TaxID=133901 RepID=A0A9C6WVA6_FRAOC|nr:uncharacterized protein LOC113209234 [Frankliniella occidentalis]